MAKNTITEEQIKKQKFWKRHVEDCSRSGSTQVEYCRRHNLSAKSMTYWRRKFRQKAPVTFVPLMVKPEAKSARDSSPALVLCQGGYRIEIKEDFNPEVLGQVLRTLREL